MAFLSGSEYVQVVHCLFTSVLWLEIQLLRGGWDHIYRMFVPVPLFVYICIAVGDPSNKKGWVHIKLFYTATILTDSVPFHSHPESFHKIIFLMVSLNMLIGV